MSQSPGRRVEALCILGTSLAIVIGILWAFRRQAPDYKVRCGPGPAFSEWSVNMTGVKEYEGGVHWSEGGLVFPPGTFWSGTDGSVFGCPCAVKPCLRMCCVPQGEGCRPANLTQFKSLIRHVYEDPKFHRKEVNESHFYVFTNWKCHGTCFPMRWRDGSYLLEDGRLFTGSGYLDQSQYCLNLNEGEGLQLEVETPRRTLSYHVRALAMLISVPFMVTTLVVYALLPSLRTLPGQLLMCYLTCLTFASLITGSMHLYRNNLSDNQCTAAAFAIQFAYLGYYFWLNIMCFDIWLMFSDLSAFRNKNSIVIKKSERRRFLLYSCYGWGGPLLITAATVVMAFLRSVPPHYGKPHLGPRPLDCWFYDDFAAMIYFFLPAGILLGVNMLLFLFTSYSIWKHSTQVKKLFSGSENESNKVNKTRFNHYLKLFLSMGLGSVLHSIFYALEKLDIYSISLASDLYNGLQGLPIFIVFTFNYRTLQLLQEKFKPSKDHPSSPNQQNRL